MTWQKWILIVFLAINVLATILMIGRPRQILTPAAAAIVVVINGLLVWLVVTS